MLIKLMSLVLHKKVNTIYTIVMVIIRHLLQKILIIMNLILLIQFV